MRLTVATAFATWPPHSGAALRNFNLYRMIARHCEVEIVALVKQEAGEFDGLIAPNLRERRIPISDRHLQEELRICEQASGRPVGDFTVGSLYPLTPRFGAALQESCERADIVVASHPHLFRALRRYTNRPLVYEAPDVEIDLKAEHLPENIDGLKLLSSIERTETLCIAEADLVFACNSHDRGRFIEVFGADPERVKVVPNGADLAGIPMRLWTPEDGAASTPLQCVFLASWGGPNNDAAEFVVQLSSEVPDISFVIAGSVAHFVQSCDLPANLRLVPDVSITEKVELLRASQIALNPVEGGSGDNIKIGEYACAGALILTTPFGARGYPEEVTSRFLVRERAEFASALMRPVDWKAAGADASMVRRWFAEHRDWEAIGDQCFAALKAWDYRERLEVADLVSILVPMFNGEPWIEECVRSLAGQSYTNIEILVIDDGSTDEGSTVVQRISEHDRRVRLLHHANWTNKGVNRSLELGLQSARGAYIAFCDADDVWRSDKLALQIAALKRHPDTVMCHSLCKVFGDAGDQAIAHAQKHFDWLPTTPVYDLLAKPESLAMTYVLNSSMVMKAEALRDIDFGCSQTYQSEDFLITLLLSTKGTFISLEDRLVNYRLHSKSYTSRVLTDLKRDLYSRLEMLMIFVTRIDDPGLKQRARNQIQATLWLLESNYGSEAADCLTGT